MRGRSRTWLMALTAALAVLPAARSPLSAAEPVTGTVWLVLQITGLPQAKCRLDIRPGHPACKFDPIALEVAGQGGSSTIYLKPLPIKATSIGADQDCTFAITIREPDQPPRTYRRGLRLTEPRSGEPADALSLRVFLSAPSLAARETGTSRR